MSAKRAAIRLDYTGTRWERWDNFAQEWLPMPQHWTRAEAKDFTARIVGVMPSEVVILDRAKVPA